MGLWSQSAGGKGRRRARGAGGRGQRERAEPKMCLGREEGGREFRALTPAPWALLEEVTGPFITHPAPAASTAAHGPPTSGQCLAPWPMSACCWPRPPGRAEEGGRKGGREAEGGRRERAELASHFPPPCSLPSSLWDLREIKGAKGAGDFLCLTLWWSSGVWFDSETQQSQRRKGPEAPRGTGWKIEGQEGSGAPQVAQKGGGSAGIRGEGWAWPICSAWQGQDAEWKGHGRPPAAPSSNPGTAAHWHGTWAHPLTSQSLGVCRTPVPSPLASGPGEAQHLSSESMSRDYPLRYQVRAGQPGQHPSPQWTPKSLFSAWKSPLIGPSRGSSGANPSLEMTPREGSCSQEGQAV